MKYLLFFIVVFTCVLQSCSIEKRRYTGGFHLERHHSSHSSSKSNEGGSLSTESNCKEVEVADIISANAQTNVEETSTTTAKKTPSNITCPQQKDVSNTVSVLKIKKESTRNTHLETPYPLATDTIAKTYVTQKKNANATSSVVSSVMSWIFHAIHFVAITSQQLTFQMSLITLLGPGAILAFVALAFASAAIKTIDSHPGVYSNRKDAINGGGMAIAFFYQLAVSLFFIFLWTYLGLYSWN